MGVACHLSMGVVPTPRHYSRESLPPSPFLPLPSINTSVYNLGFDAIDVELSPVITLRYLPSRRECDFNVLLHDIPNLSGF